MYGMYCTESVYIILQFNGNFPFYNKLSLSATYHELNSCAANFQYIYHFTKHRIIYVASVRNNVA